MPKYETTVETGIIGLKVRTFRKYVFRNYKYTIIKDQYIVKINEFCHITFLSPVWVILYNTQYIVACVHIDKRLVYSIQTVGFRHQSRTIVWVLSYIPFNSLIKPPYKLGIVVIVLLLPHHY